MIISYQTLGQERRFYKPISETLREEIRVRKIQSRKDQMQVTSE